MLNPSVFGDNAAVVVGGNYGHRPDAKGYLFSASLSQVRFQFGRTYWPLFSRAKSLMTSLDYGHGIASRTVIPGIELVSGAQASVGYGVLNWMDGSGQEGVVGGVLLAGGARLSGPGFRITPYFAPGYFFARHAIVGYNCSGPDCYGYTRNGLRFSTGGGVRVDVLSRVSLEAGVRKTQTTGSISRRSFGVSYRLGNIDGRGLSDAGTFTLQMDNDFLARVSSLLDEDYTQGFHFTFNRKESPVRLDRVLERLDHCPIEQGCVVRSSTLVGQEIYTPRYYPSVAADDRPFGGWLYGGAQSSAMTDRDLTLLSVKIGVTGPPSLAQQLQVTFHELVPAYIIPPGWTDQLKFEPGLIVTAAKKNYSELRAGSASVGLIKSASASLGNILTDVEAGLTLRAGFNAEHPWTLEKHRGFGVHASFGLREDIVLHNLFLDGNTLRAGPHVDRVPFVWQKELGAGISFGATSLDYQKIVRSEEFTTGRSYHPYGTISLTRRGKF